MIATPVVPGRAYHVRGMGLEFTALAGSAVEAICMAIDILLVQGVG